MILTINATIISFVVVWGKSLASRSDFSASFDYIVKQTYTGRVCRPEGAKVMLLTSAPGCPILVTPMAVKPVQIKPRTLGSDPEVISS